MSNLSVKKIVSAFVLFMFVMSDFAIAVEVRQYTLRPEMSFDNSGKISRRGFIIGAIFAPLLASLELSCSRDIKELPVDDTERSEYKVVVNFFNYTDTNFQWGVKFPNKGTLKIEVSQGAEESVCHIGQVYVKFENWYQDRTYVFKQPLEIDHGVVKFPCSQIPKDFGNIRTISLYYFSPDKISYMRTKKEEAITEYGKEPREDEIGEDVDWMKFNYDFSVKYGNPYHGFININRALIDNSEETPKATKTSL